MYIKIIKPLIDFLLSLSLLLIFSPAFLIIIFLLLIVNRGKVFFVQLRPGRNQKKFHVIKFKTMNDQKDLVGNLLPDHQRITKIGSFIRKTSLDEIPQLINVLKGDMSFIGPRPLLEEYLPLYNEIQRKRHDVKPGITGLAQINGRNTISWEDKFNYDIYYVDNISFIMDIKIFFKTIIKVISSSDINNSDNNTMPFFKGSQL